MDTAKINLMISFFFFFFNQINVYYYYYYNGISGYGT